MENRRGRIRIIDVLFVTPERGDQMRVSQRAFESFSDTFLGEKPQKRRGGLNPIGTNIRILCEKIARSGP